MGFTTQGKIKVVIEAAGKKIKILPIDDYRISHRNASYTIFVDDDKKVRSFAADKTFVVDDPKIADCLIELAVKDIRLEITIDDADEPKVTAIQAPA